MKKSIFSIIKNNGTSIKHVVCITALLLFFEVIAGLVAHMGKGLIVEAYGYKLKDEVLGIASSKDKCNGKHQ